MTRYSRGSTVGKWLSWVLVGVVVGGPGVAQETAPEPQRSKEIRAAAKRFFGSSQVSRLSLSPDGESIAGLYSQDGIESVVVRRIDDSGWLPILKFPDPNARMRLLLWANDDRLLVSTEGPDPTTSYVRTVRRLFGIDRDGENLLYLGSKWARTLRTSPQFEDTIIDRLRDDPSHVLLSLHLDEPYPTVYRMNVHTGKLKCVQQSRSGITRWFTDHDGQVRAGSGWKETTFRLIARSSSREEFQELDRFLPFEENGLSFSDFSYEPNRLYVTHRPDGDREELAEYDLTTGKIVASVFAHPRFDVPAWLEFDREKRELSAVGYFGEGPERHFVTPKAAARQSAIDRALPETFNYVVSRDHKNERVIVRTESDVRLPEHYLFDRIERTLLRLPTEGPATQIHEAGIQLSPMREVRYAARDGLEIPAYLTMPHGGEGKKLPVIIYPHGGPAVRDVRAYSPDVQFLVHLGYAVFQPNFRGSTGYGRRFEDAGHRQWGLAMQDDVTDGVRWLIETGIADPDRICIYGSSYGGYAALTGLIKTPELYRCGASFAGVMDLRKLLADDRKFHFAPIMVSIVGRRGKDKAQLKSTSPLQNADKVRVPVFLAHGEVDYRVDVSHTLEMEKALRKRGKPVELLVFEHGAHGTRGESDRIELYSRLGQFFEKHLPTSPTDHPVGENFDSDALADGGGTRR